MDILFDKGVTARELLRKECGEIPTEELFKMLQQRVRP
jgi:hypothetical protein